jgi:tetratricopeptide (TPR) repeat protein
METDVVEKLRANGNDAFKRGEFEEALDCYQKAIETEESLSKRFGKLAILHSNSARVYLKQKKFDQAISAASTSLEHDPGFKKSLLRRGIANVELNKHEGATDDLRSFLRMEPKSKKAVSYLRQVFSFAKLSDGLRKSFIGHYLRRAVVNWKPGFVKFCCDPAFAKYLFRLTV